MPLRVTKQEQRMLTYLAAVIMLGLIGFAVL